MIETALKNSRTPGAQVILQRGNELGCLLSALMEAWDHQLGEDAFRIAGKVLGDLGWVAK